MRAVRGGAAPASEQQGVSMPARIARPRALRRALATVTAVVLGLLTAFAASAGAALPVFYSFPVGLAAATANPNGSPPGANDWSCRPSAAHPRPVVLVHGTFENRIDNWNAASPFLKNEGYCVFALNYGGGALGDFIGGLQRVPASAAELSAFVDRVLAATGAAEVDLVGHSQGGMMPRWYVKFLGGAAKVHNLVGLAPSNHGTSLSGLATFAGFIPGALDLVGTACPACQDQVIGSDVLTRLNAGGDTVPGVVYTVIATQYDEVVTPYRSAFLSGATNITVQSRCILDFGEHLAIPYDRVALRLVENALDPATATRPPCVPITPLVGG
jgi:triacylglycerol esterase/lipase EstA (alpha/beta hydrolase family)